MKTLVLITARGGSKGIPNKNIKQLAGKPLILYSIEAALANFDATDICVSTDAQNIIDIALSAGLKVPFVRPAHLATDEASSNSVLLHALAHYEQQGMYYDTVLLLQPTSPFRNKDHIASALATYNTNIELLIGVTETNANPYNVLYEEDTSGILQKSKEGNFTRRQDCPTVWQANGAIYIINVAALKKTGNLSLLQKQKFVMDKKASLDVDTELDWQFAEFLMNQTT
jgi:CMP-N,N'-diacetyllegionaminic acid synthase